MTMTLKSHDSWADHQRGLEGEDRISVHEEDFCTIVYPSEPVRGLAPEVCGLAEFTITTDPTKAPADALLEGAGYYVMPGDKVAVGYDETITATVAHCRGDTVWAHDLRVLERGGWDPYSWDVKPEASFVPVVTLECESGNITDLLRQFDMRVAWGDGPMEAITVSLGNTTKTSCARCNGSGQVAGALGVGLTWTCGECAGKGVV